MAIGSFLGSLPVIAAGPLEGTIPILEVRMVGPLMLTTREVPWDLVVVPWTENWAASLCITTHLHQGKIYTAAPLPTTLHMLYPHTSTRPL